MGWIFVDDDDKKESMRNNMRENMREKMMRMTRNENRMYDGNRDSFHDEEWCKGYEQGWKDCEEKLAKISGFRNGM